MKVYVFGRGDRVVHRLLDAQPVAVGEGGRDVHERRERAERAGERQELLHRQHVELQGHLEFLVEVDRRRAVQHHGNGGADLVRDRDLQAQAR